MPRRIVAEIDYKKFKSVYENNNLADCCKILGVSSSYVYKQVKKYNLSLKNNCVKGS